MILLIKKLLIFSRYMNEKIGSKEYYIKVILKNINFYQYAKTPYYETNIEFS